MKRIFTLGMILCTALMGFAQTDTTGKQNNEVDTIKVGGMIIIRKHGENEITNNKKEKTDNSPLALQIIQSQYQLVDN